jgi:hypothetical protein
MVFPPTHFSAIKPGFENYQSAKGSEKLSVDKIGQYKENERKMNELLLEMRSRYAV